ncbi:MAG: UDP-N-acetylmuramoyl-L-alanyl-D-glutamate--2,6-diaminopimelate ligase [Planctomycetaceae bacterium]
MSLRRILPTTSFVGCADIPVTEAVADSRKCQPGCLFVVVSGSQQDGRAFVNEAISKGATALLVEQPIVGVAVPQCVVPNVREAYSRVCLTLARNPQRSLNLTGVTGTNGKTTVTWLLRSIFEAAGHVSGLIGTVEYSCGKTSQPAPLTTPDPATFADLLRGMVSSGASHAFLELSSHALHQSRLGGTSLKSAVVTNVTQDHFDYHGDADSYLAAKQKIADYCSNQTPLIVNADNVACRKLIERWSRRNVIPFGLQPGADARGLVLDMLPDRTHVRFEILNQSFECAISLPGRHNVANCVAAATVAVVAGIGNEAIVRGLERVAFIPGRLQPVDLGQPFRVFIDYAHTPDALSQVLESLRSTTKGRLICVFGAGGDRDASKRPLMGNAANAADLVVVTSDNPRSESPEKIIADIREGVQVGDCHIEVQRGAAIDWAIRNANEGDCVLIAGKGHEKTQTVGGEVLSFDDRLVAAEAIGQHHFDPAREVPSMRAVSWMR